MLRAKFLRIGQKMIAQGAWYLAPLSFFYFLGVFCRNRLYDWKLLPTTRVNKTVVSVGNIVAGGTGKTPFVLLLAQAFSHRKVAILSRGYGEMPDEAMLLANRLPHVQVVVGKDRAKLAKEVDAELLILDDGFQHRKLERDFDIVLVREKKEHYLPWGFLRDEPRRLKMAEVFSEKEMTLNVRRIVDLQGNEIRSIQGQKVGIFSGIARPQKFKETVLSLGAEVVTEVIFGDHEKADLRKLKGATLWICTEKDFVKLPKTDLSICYLEMELCLAFSAMERWDRLVAKLRQKLDNGPHL